MNRLPYLTQLEDISYLPALSSKKKKEKKEKKEGFPEKVTLLRPCKVLLELQQRKVPCFVSVWTDFGTMVLKKKHLFFSGIYDSHHRWLGYFSPS